MLAPKKAAKEIYVDLIVYRQIFAANSRTGDKKPGEMMTR